MNDLTESALRGVVGTSTLGELIGEHRQQIPDRTMVELQETLDDYLRRVQTHLAREGANTGNVFGYLPMLRRSKQVEYECI